MKLTQKAPYLPTCEFTVRDRCLHVKRSTRTGSRSHEIPFADINPLTTEHQGNGVGWHVAGCALIALAAGLLGLSYIASSGDDSVAWWFGAALAGLTGLRCLAEGRKETFSRIVFSSINTGRTLIELHETLPTPVHVREFVEILKEKIAAETDDLWDHTDHWRG
jgi:hypothetical protein